MKPILLVLMSILSPLFSSAQNNNFLKELMQSQPKQFQAFIESPDKYEIQIIYTQIDRNENNRPHFTSYRYNTSKTRYFYPASTVKFPLSILALQKLNRLKVKDLDRKTPFTIHYGKGKDLVSDPAACNGKPSIGLYIKKIFLASDNWAYNYFYEFFGQDEMHKLLAEKSFGDVRILQRFIVGDTEESSKYTAAFDFYLNGDTIYSQPARKAQIDHFKNIPPILYGKAYIDSTGNRVNQPFNFRIKNFFPLYQQQELLRRILFPENVPETDRFELTDEDYRFLYKYMSMRPRESKPCPDYTNLGDAYVKFLMYGGDETVRIPEHIRIFNKPGDAYGYMIDNAYIVDFKNNIEFMLSAVIATNTDGVYDDGINAYETIGKPFMKNLGQLIYDYELKRERDYPPDLSKFSDIDYSKND